MAKPVVHVEVRGLSPSRLREFYQEVFGWDRNEGLSIGEYSVAEIGSGDLTVGIGPEFGAKHILVFTTFLDPAGNQIGLVETPRN